MLKSLQEVRRRFDHMRAHVDGEIRTLRPKKRSFIEMLPRRQAFDRVTLAQNALEERAERHNVGK